MVKCQLVSQGCAIYPDYSHLTTPCVKLKQKKLGQADHAGLVNRKDAFHAVSTLSRTTRLHQLLYLVKVPLLHCLPLVDFI